LTRTPTTNWKELYNDKAKFSVLTNGWETWEPKDKSKNWSCEEEKISNEKNGPRKKDWWEQEDEGYNTDSKVNTEFLWEDETKRIIKERLGVVDKGTDDDSGIEGEEEENYEEEDGEKRGDKSKEYNGDEDDEDNDNDYDKGHQKRHSNRKKGK
jgi:hypothetical protein